LNFWVLLVTLLVCWLGQAFAQQSLEELLRNAADSTRPVEQTRALYELKDNFAQEPRVVVLFLNITGDTNSSFLHSKLAIQGLKQSGNTNDSVVAAMQAVVQRAMAQTGGQSDAEALAREGVQVLSAIGPTAYTASSILIAVATNPQTWLPLRLDAIRALAAIGPAAQNVAPGLEKLFLNADENRQLRLAAIDALACIGSSSIPAFRALCRLITTQPEVPPEELKELVTHFARMGANVASNALSALEPWLLRSLHEEAVETVRFARAHAAALEEAPIAEAGKVVAQIGVEAKRRPCWPFLFWAFKLWPSHPKVLLGIIMIVVGIVLLFLIIMKPLEMRRRMDAILKSPQTTHDVGYVQPVPAYQRIFTEGAATKADDVLAYARQCLGREKPDKMIYLSLGGGDGSEIAWAMKQGGFGKGLLVEWMDLAVDAAKAKVPTMLQPGQEVQYICGDVAQKFDQVERQLQDWRKAGMTGLLISAQAVLHELLWRADPRQFSWEQLVSLFDGFDVKIFHAREPCLPPLDGGWRERVRLRVPYVSGTDLCNAMELIQRHYLAHLKGELWKAFEGKVVKVGDVCVAPGPLVVEFLHKFMRHSSREHLRHELQECLTAFDPKPFKLQLEAMFGGAQHVQLDYISSGGFSKEYHRFGIEAANAEHPADQLGVPHASCLIKAFKSPFEPLSRPDVGRALAGVTGGSGGGKVTPPPDAPQNVAREDTGGGPGNVALPTDGGQKRRRRIDAAAPDRAGLGDTIDLLVQVRTPNSPMLGRDDWPLANKPPSTAADSREAILPFAIDPQTGRLAPTTLRVRVIAPDFAVQGLPEMSLQVPPKGNSPLLTFLLRTQKKGACRINVEVLTLAGEHVGTIPVATLVNGSAPQPVTNSASLVLVILVSPDQPHTQRPTKDDVAPDGKEGNKPVAAVAVEVKQASSMSSAITTNIPGKRILFLGAHADDIEIGCGGTAAKLAAMGRHIAFAQAAFCGSGRKKEAEAAASLLGLSVAKGNLFLGLIPDKRLNEHPAVLQNWLDELAEQFSPETIFVHRGDDTHPDHVALYQAAIRVFVRHSVWLYPISKLAVQATPFTANHWENITSYFDMKLKLCACHASQASKGIYLDPGHLTDLARIAHQVGFGRTGGHAEEFFIHTSRSAGTD
jgi:LmbE family N-acetylglucosaminyl deacetylase